MVEQRSRGIANSDRWSFLWLGITAVLLLFSYGKWIIPLAVWLSPVFALRFIRTQKPIRGYLIFVAVGSFISYFTLQGMVPVSAVQYIFTIVIGGLTSILPFLADRLITPRLKGFVSTLVLPLGMTAYEYLSSLVGSFASWGATAYTQVDNLPLIQIVSVTGIWGLTFLIYWLASVVNWAWEQQFEWGVVRVGLGTYACILALVLLFGGARLALFPPAESTVRVSALTSPLYDDVAKEFFPLLIGAGPAADVDWGPVLAKAGPANDDLFERSERAARAGAKIVFWSEASGTVWKEDEAAFIERGRQLASKEGIYLGMALGTLYPNRNELPDKKMIENKVVLVDPSGNVAWEYLKARPVPGPEAAITVRGNGKIPVLATSHGRIATAICFDMDAPNEIRQAGQGGTDVMFAPSSDWKEIDPYHTQMAIFRAVENGFSLVRPAKYGLSAAADYQGRVLAAMDHFTTKDRVMIAHVPTKGVGTIYSRIGDVFAWLSIAGFLAVVGWVVAKRRAA